MNISGYDEQNLANGVHRNGELPPRAHLYDYLIVLARYRWWLAGFVTIGLALVIAWVMFAPHVYSAGATLMPPEKSRSNSFGSFLMQSGGFDLASFGENSSAEVFVTMLRSRALADSLVRRFDLVKKYGLPKNNRLMAIQILQSGFDVSADRQGIITINYNMGTSFNPSEAEQREAAEFAAQVVNAAIEVLDHLNRRKQVSSAVRTRDYLARVKQQKRAELDSITGQLLLFQKNNRALALDQQVEASVMALAEKTAAIQKAELELTKLQGDLTTDSRMLQAAQAQLQKLRQQKSQIEEGEGAGQIPLGSLPDIGRTYASLKLDMKVATEVWAFLEQQYNQEDVQSQRDLPTVSVLDSADVPERRTSPRRGLTVMIALPVLFVVGTLLAFISDSYKRRWRYSDPERAEEFRRALHPKRYRSGAKSA